MRPAAGRPVKQRLPGYAQPDPLRRLRPGRPAPPPRRRRTPAGQIADWFQRLARRVAHGRGQQSRRRATPTSPAVLAAVRADKRDGRFDGALAAVLTLSSHAAGHRRPLPAGRGRGGPGRFRGPRLRRRPTAGRSARRRRPGAPRPCKNGSTVWSGRDADGRRRDLRRPRPWSARRCSSSCRPRPPGLASWAWLEPDARLAGAAAGLRPGPGGGALRHRAGGDPLDRLSAAGRGHLRPGPLHRAPAAGRARAAGNPRTGRDPGRHGRRHRRPRRLAARQPGPRRTR